MIILFDFSVILSIRILLIKLVTYSQLISIPLDAPAAFPLVAARLKHVNVLSSQPGALPARKM